MIAIICGSRTIDDYKAVREGIERTPWADEIRIVSHGDAPPDASEPEGDTIPVGGCAEGWRVKPEEGPIVFIESARKRRDKQIWVSPEGVLGGVYWPASTPVRVIDKGGEQ